MSKLAGFLGLAAVAVMGCGGGQTTAPASGGGGVEPAPAETASAEPDPWAGWQGYHKMSKGPWVSNTHGKRLVEIYVNDVGFEAYKANAAMPVGSIVVKPSWENDGGKPGADGPLFVMIKKDPGYAPDNGDWFYAFEWKQPTGKWADKGPIKWMSPSDSVEYCLDCHDTEGDHQLGGVPEAHRAW